MEDPAGAGINDSAAVMVTAKIMVAAVIVLFLVVFFVVLLHLYATRWFWYAREQESAAAASVTTRRRRLEFSPGYLESAAGLRRGLDPTLLKSLPIVTFNTKDFTDGLECAVCLSELADGEKARLLPKCNHGFHLDCIDMWFHSHSTCPLCRNTVSFQPRVENSAAAVVGVYSIESPNFPTNVLFWGNQNGVTTLGACLEGDRQAHSPHPPPPPPSSAAASSSSSSSNRPDGGLVIDIIYLSELMKLKN